MDPALSEALARLDEWLGEVCLREEARARHLAPEGVTGWPAVQAMTEPRADALAFDGPGALTAPVLCPDRGHPLARARDVFRLDPVVADALVVLIAPHIEPRYRTLYGVLQDDARVGWATQRLLYTVLGRTPARRRALMQALTPEGALMVNGLVVPAPGAFPPLGLPLDLAPEVAAALLSAGGAQPETPEAPAACVLYGPGDASAAALALPGAGAVIELTRADPLAQALAGARRAALMGQRAILIASALTGAETDQVARALHALTTRAGVQVALLTRAPVPVPWPHTRVPAPTWLARRAHWVEQTGQRGLTLPDAALDALASSHRLGADGVAQAIDGATSPDLESLQASAFRLAAVPVPHARAVRPRRRFADLVVSERTRAGIERLIYFIRHRDRVAETRGLAHRYGLDTGPVALFSGRSGTGKTLAAEVIAHELGRPLYVVDLSRLVSKYIGETETHIDEALSAGEQTGAVLFFDEADALFAQRTEVSSSNDRFANLEVGYLLQRIEQHDGPVILATNLRQVIDEAFVRRFHTRVEFPLPDPPARARIWSLMLPDSVARAPDLDLETLAQAHRLSGGDIRNAALKAILMAEQAGEVLTRAHLDQAVAIELLEQGRLSRAEPPAPTDRGDLVRRLTTRLEAVIEATVSQCFLKSVPLVHGPPTKEALAGRRPAVSLALYRLAAPRGGASLRLGFVVSAWSTRPEEEYELLGVLHATLAARPVQTLGEARVTMRVQESADFDLLHRFWSSHNHPVRASIVVDVEIEPPSER